MEKLNGIKYKLKVKYARLIVARIYSPISYLGE